MKMKLLIGVQDPECEFLVPGRIDETLGNFRIITDTQK